MPRGKINNDCTAHAKRVVVVILFSTNTQKHRKNILWRTSNFRGNGSMLKKCARTIPKFSHLCTSNRSDFFGKKLGKIFEAFAPRVLAWRLFPPVHKIKRRAVLEKRGDKSGEL